MGLLKKTENRLLKPINDIYIYIYIYVEQIC